MLGDPVVVPSGLKIALPMAGHRPVRGLGRALRDRGDVAQDVGPLGGFTARLRGRRSNRPERSAVISLTNALHDAGMPGCCEPPAGVIRRIVG